MKKTMTKIWSMMLVVCMLASMIVLPVTAEGVTAEIILETTNATPTAEVPLGETLMVKVAGVEATGYKWFSKHKNGGTDYQLGTGATFVPPASLTEQYAADAVYCIVEYDGGSVTTEAVAIEPYVNSIPYGWDYKNGNNHYKGIPNAENSNADYTFYVDGKGFVLAKEQNVKGSAYFIVALDAYGDIFTGDDAAKKSSIEWKNYYGQSGYGKDGETTMVTKLLGDGNTFDSLVAGSTTQYSIPDVFDSYIDKDHNWAYNADKNGSLRMFNAAIALPSYSDYINYQNRIGHIDNLRAEAGDQPVLLRDLYGTASVSEEKNTTGKVIGSGLSTSNAGGPYLVRPCFWLTKDFFEKNAINLEEAGSGIISVMTDETYTNQETIKATYINAGKEDQYLKYLAPKSAEIILETTNAAPTAAVPLAETLKIKYENIVPTGYEWYGKGATNNYKIGEGESFVAPANLYEKYGKSTAVYCKVSYDGGTITTEPVTMEEYVHNIPYGWDYKNGGNHYKGVPNAENSDSKYVFYVDGKGFVIAKEQNVKGSAYFIMALDAYGDIFTGDNADAKSTIEWKNIYAASGFGTDGETTMVTKLLGDGNTYEKLVADSTKTYALPDFFDAYIDADHSWAYAADQYGTIKEMVAAVTIPSYSDYVNYAERVGHKDNLRAEAGDKPVLLRDLYGTAEPRKMGKVIVSGLSTSKDAEPYLVRPCFWLTKDFFEKNAIDLSKAGRGVIDIINNEVYTNQETVKATYQAAGKLDELEFYTQPLAANIILETTNAAPAEGTAVPLAETLKISMTGAVPTGYKWYSKGETTDYVIGEGESFVAPANLKARYNKATGVYCVVSYDGGEITTDVVTMEEYVNTVPTSYWNLDGKNWWKSWGLSENSNKDYVFYVDGKGFVLAKEQNVKDAAYFVMALDAYGDIYSGDAATADAPIISETVWKNYYGQSGFGNDNGTTMESKLLGDGNTYAALAAGNANTYALPDAFDAYIDMDHSWGLAADKWGTVNTVTGGVMIPSLSDYVVYSDRVGYKDNLQKDAGAQPTLLRDLINKSDSSTNPAGQVIAGEGSDTSKAGPFLVRPVFWLSKDFFEKNAIDLSKAGSGVIDIIKNSVYTDKDVAAQTYADAGMEFEYNLYVNGSFAEGISSSDVVWTDKDGNTTTLANATSLKVRFTLANGNDAAQPAVVFVAAYGADNTLVGVNIVNYAGDDAIPAKGSVPVECGIEGFAAGMVTRAQVMVWESVTNPVPLLTVNAF